MFTDGVHPVRLCLYSGLKRTRSEDASWSDNVENVDCSINICTKEALFFLPQIWVRQGTAIFVRSLPTKSRKRLARDVFDTFTTHAGLVHDVTNTDCRAQNGSTHGRVFATFIQRRFLTNRTRNRANRVKTYYVSTFFFKFHFRVLDASSLRVIFNDSTCTLFYVMYRPSN